MIPLLRCTSLLARLRNHTYIFLCPVSLRFHHTWSFPPPNRQVVHTVLRVRVVHHQTCHSSVSLKRNSKSEKKSHRKYGTYVVSQHLNSTLTCNESVSWKPSIKNTSNPNSINKNANSQ